MNHSILIVEDEAAVRNLLAEVFVNGKYRVFTAPSAKEAFPLLRREKVDVVISDEKMPGMTGSEFLSLVRKIYPDTVRIILTGHASLESAMRAINKGEIYRFLTKPCNMFDLATTIRQALHEKALEVENRRLRSLARQQAVVIDRIEGQYPGISRVRRNPDGAVMLNDDMNETEWDKLLARARSALKQKENSSPKSP